MVLDSGWRQLVVGIQLRLLPLAWPSGRSASLSARAASLLVVAASVPAPLQGTPAFRRDADSDDDPVAIAERVKVAAQSDSVGNAERIQVATQSHSERDPIAERVEVAAQPHSERFAEPAYPHSQPDRIAERVKTATVSHSDPIAITADKNAANSDGNGYAQDQRHSSEAHGDDLAERADPDGNNQG
jgi:hypothetical protein